MKCFPLAWIALLLLSSCQKVIDLPLHNASEKYVIEGNITNQPGPYKVMIGTTGKVNEDYQFKGVSQATVLIRDGIGNEETLMEMQPGIYQTQHLTGVEGRTYTLNVTIGGKLFTASSVMPHAVSLDSLYTRELFNFSKTVKAIVPVVTDPAGLGNNYRFNQTINGVLDKTLYVYNDDFTDGRRGDWPLLREDPDSTLHIGDEVKIEMQCIDHAAYQYWFSADESSLGNGNGQPANPVTNILGGALGVFSAHTSQTRTLLIK